MVAKSFVHLSCTDKLLTPQISSPTASPSNTKGKNSSMTSPPSLNRVRSHHRMNRSYPTEPSCGIQTSVTTGSTSSGASYFAVEALIFALHMESPEGAPLSVKVGCSQVQHRLCA